MTRVLLVSPFVPPHHGGLETYISWLTLALDDAGHEVRWLSTDVRDNAAAYAVPAKDIQVGGGTSWPLVIPSRAARETVGAAVRWADVVLHQNCFWNLTFLAARAAHRQRRPQWTIVHAAFATYPGAGALMHVAARTYRALLGGTQLRYAPAIAVSRASQKFVREEYGVSAAYVPCPLPDMPAVPAVTLDRGETVRVSWVGRLAPVKAPTVAIEAVQLLARDHRVEMSMYGDGPMACDLPVSRFVVRKGAMERDDVIRGVADSHVFLSTSLADNAQLALLEAVMLGRPSVATRVGEAEEYLRHPLDVGFAEPGSAGDAARAMHRVISDWPRLARLTSERAVALREVYDPSRVAHELMSAIGLV